MNCLNNKPSGFSYDNNHLNNFFRYAFLCRLNRSNVSPQFLEMVKGEIIKVIQNYMEIDEESLDIQLTKTNSEDGERMVPALVANIPIKGMKNAGR